MIGDRRLWPLAAVQIATFGLSVVAGNWIVTLLEHQGHGRSISGVVGGLVLFAGVVTRPIGGLVVLRALAQCLEARCRQPVIGSAGVLVLAAHRRSWIAAVAALAVGLAAGFPFAAVFDMTLRLRPDAPAAAVGLVNGAAVLVILVCTPLAGLTFSLPGDGRLAFLAIGLAWASVLPAVGGHRTLWIIGFSESESHKERNMALSFGVTVLPDPPYQRLVDLMVLAESQGFEYGWTYDSHVLWQDSFPILTLAATATSTISSAIRSRTRARATRRSSQASTPPCTTSRTGAW